MTKRKYLWIAAVLILLAAIGFYKYNKYPFINKKINDVVENRTDSLYKILYDSISVNELGGDLFIHNLSIKGDTSLQKKYILNKDTAAASVLLDVFIPVLKVEGFKTAKALLNKEMVCDRIIVSNPKVLVYVFPGQKKNADLKKQGEEIYKQILGKYNLIQADSLAVINSQVIVMDFPSREIKFYTKNTNINLTDLRIDSTHNYDTSRTLFCKEIYLHTNKVFSGEENAVSLVTNLTFNTRSKILAIDNISHNGLKSGGSLNGYASGISITGVEATGTIDSMNIVIGKATFTKAWVEIKGKEKAAKDPAGFKLLTGWVKSFSLKQFQAVSLSLKVLATDRHKNDLVINNSTLKARNMSIDTTSRFGLSLLKNVAELNLTNNLLSFKSADNLYNYKLGGVEINNFTRTISLRDFTVSPTADEQTFAKKAGVQKDRYNINIKNLVCTSVNFDSLIAGSIDVGLVKTSNSSLKIYRDISYPLDSISKVGKHPHQMIGKIEFPIKVRKFEATNTLIEYKEKNGLSDTSGSVRFEKSTISITNITNHPNTANEKTEIDFQTLFLGKIPLNANIRFNLGNLDKGYYQVTGSIKKPFNGQLLNHVILPMGLVRVDKGIINNVEFNFTGDNLNARGQFVMKYNNLRLSLYEKDKQKAKFDKKGIVSLVANVIVKNANPANNKIRRANIVYRRDDYKSFFNMIWKFLFAGIKDNIGATF